MIIKGSRGLGSMKSRTKTLVELLRITPKRLGLKWNNILKGAQIRIILSINWWCRLYNMSKERGKLYNICPTHTFD